MREDIVYLHMCSKHSRGSEAPTTCTIRRDLLGFQWKVRVRTGHGVSRLNENIFLWLLVISIATEHGRKGAEERWLGIVHCFHTMSWACCLLFFFSTLQGGTSFQTPWQDRRGLPRLRHPTLCACAARPWASRLPPSRPVWWVIFYVAGVALVIISLGSVKSNWICSYIHITLATVWAMGMSVSLYASFSLPTPKCRIFLLSSVSVPFIPHNK